ncbi:MAG: UDP-N-acetylglucosamine 2-epimerase, partial [Chloroflexi bacterium]|nr:UDP-N-acetylglucosamine 2-epimerase [Chloroflexota bacterium]
MMFKRYAEELSPPRSVVTRFPFGRPLGEPGQPDQHRLIIDDALRHSITKLSHLHFVATEEYARRVMQLGEEPWRIIVSGAPGLDNIESVRLLDPGEFQATH